jgi:hypothetical protein
VFDQGAASSSRAALDLSKETPRKILMLASVG